MADVLSNQDVHKEHFTDSGLCSGAKKETRLLPLVSVASTRNTVFTESTQ